MASHNALDSPESYAVAWIAALPIERAAAEAMLDEEHAAPTSFNRHQTDANVYTWGRVGEHNIVIASLAAGVYGITSAATTASSLLASLPSICIGIFVGIGGGISRPDDGHDIRLGDIVVSQPDGTTGGVCQYDLAKVKLGGELERKGFLGRPPTVLLNALTRIQAVHERKDSKVSLFLQEMLEQNPKMAKRSKQNPGYAYQGLDNDRLFNSSCHHVAGPDCQACNTVDEIQRDPRDTTDPEIHYGTIASGNTLVKDAAARYRIVVDIGENCLCFEMEAAGLMNHFPCLVIRGICDYADSTRMIDGNATPRPPPLRTQRSSWLQRQINEVQDTTVATKTAANLIMSDLGLDSVAAFNIVRFLRKLADAGQAILCTIHQTSAVLFEYFDELLRLESGGRVVFHGPLGKDIQNLIEHFESNGAPKCQPHANPAECMLEAIGAGDPNYDGKDWGTVWAESPNYEERSREIDDMTSKRQHINPSKSLKNDLEYATPLLMQMRTVVKRSLVSYWRTPKYIVGKILLHILTGLFNCFTFWRLDYSTTNYQSRLFSIFMTLTIAPPLIQQLQPVFLKSRNIFHSRENNRKFTRGLLGSRPPLLPRFHTPLLPVPSISAAGGGESLAHEYQASHRVLHL